MNYKNKPRFLAKACLLGLVAALGFGWQPVCAQSVSNGFWQAQNIYQVITDRFYDGDAANNNTSGNYNASGTTSVHGGDFLGLEQKLDYIKALGATAIWISPVVLNANGEFHGYAGRDFYKVDPHWGTLSNLQHFVQAAHAKGLLVINDIICNHGGDLVYSTDAGYAGFLAPPAGYALKYRSSKQYASPFNTNALNPSLTNLFHNNGGIPDYNTPQHYQLGELSGLDDFRTESDYIRSNMVAVYNFWIEQAGFDGFRIDTVKHIENGFWQTWSPAVHTFAATNSAKPNFFMFGEVYDGNEALCGSYTGTKSGGAFMLDSVVDYPLYFLVGSVFAAANGATSQIDAHYTNVVANYDTNAQMRLVTFLDNHDQPRFLNSSTTNRLMVALAFLYTSRGIPCLYYGTEQAFNGATDPYDREDMFAGGFEQGPSLGDNFNMTQPLFQLVAKLNNFRRLYPAMTLGAHVSQANSSGPGLLAYSRRLGTQEVFVVFNTSGAAQSLPSCNTLYPAGTTLVNLLETNETFTVQAGSVTPTINVPSTTAKILIAQSQWRPLDPTVASFTPAHDSAGISALTPVVIQFNQPMDTNVVQAALTITPAAGRTFSWLPGNSTLTVTPTTNWPGLTWMTVRLADTAQAANITNRFIAAFESRFRTATATDLIAPAVTMNTPTNNATAAGLLTISGTASDNLSVAKVEVQVDSLGWIQASGTTSWNYSLNTSNYLNGLHTISTRSTDGAGNPSTVVSRSVRFVNQPGNYLQRLACGNPGSVTDCTGNLWVQDVAYATGGFGYSGGGGGFVGNNVNGICAGAQSLYQRERFGSFSYLFDCPIGVYETTLLEAETWFSVPGKRVFNVFIQGGQVLTNFDIFAAAGGQNLPLTRVFTNSVSNSQLQILFTPVVDNARVSGVQVRKIADVFSDTDGIPDWWRLAYFSHALGQVGDLSRGSDDADADGVSNLTEFLNGANPLSPASVPAVPAFNISQIILTNGTVRLSCAAATNWTFQLQRRDTLGGATGWSNINVALPGTGGTVIFSDGLTPASATRFYRVQAL